MARKSSKKRRKNQPAQPPIVHRTAWHPILGQVLTVVLPPQRGYEVLSEVQLNFQPLRADYIIICKDSHAEPASPVLSPLTRLLGRCNVIELTGPTCTLEAQDFLWTQVSPNLVCLKLEIKDDRDLRMFRVASRLTDDFRRRAEQRGVTFHQVEPGVHEILGLDHVTYCIETAVAGDHILRVLSPQYLKDPMALFSLLSEEERAIFWSIQEQIRQFSKDPRTPSKYPDWKEIEMTAQEMEDRVIRRGLSQMTPEERLKGMSAEERLKGLPPEERLKGLDPEEEAKLLALLLAKRERQQSKR